MDKATARQVVEFAARHHFPVIDLTGGAPEMNENLPFLIEELRPLTPRLILRSNLVAMDELGRRDLMELCSRLRVEIIASFPALNEAQAESQRGDGVFKKSLEVLRRLNALGYGKKPKGLVLNLVTNPTGAFVPSDQQGLARRYHEVLCRKWGVEFNELFSFANVPLGRFASWLAKSGNLEDYMNRLAAAFNPCALPGVMCRTLISVAWDGHLYDCDFNLAAEIPLGGVKTHISELNELPEPGAPIAYGDHCYACTAGAGFT